MMKNVLLRKLTHPKLALDYRPNNIGQGYDGEDEELDALFSDNIIVKYHPQTGEMMAL